MSGFVQVRLSAASAAAIGELAYTVSILLEYECHQVLVINIMTKANVTIPPSTSLYQNSWHSRDSCLCVGFSEETLFLLAPALML